MCPGRRLLPQHVTLSCVEPSWRGKQGLSVALKGRSRMVAQAHCLPCPLLMSICNKQRGAFRCWGPSQQPGPLLPQPPGVCLLASFPPLVTKRWLLVGPEVPAIFTWGMTLCVHTPCRERGSTEADTAHRATNGHPVRYPEDPTLRSPSSHLFP